MTLSYRALTRRAPVVAVALLCTLGLAAPAVAVPTAPDIPAAVAPAPDATADRSPLTDAVEALEGGGTPGTASPLAGSSGAAGDLGSLGSLPASPSGAVVDHVEEKSDRLYNIFLRSSAMPGELMQVNFLRAKDWDADPARTFPSVWMLGGLYGSERANGWLTSGTAREFFDDKNVNVVMPVGGTGTFYSDWQRPDNGETIRWETFLTGELPGILSEQFRTNDRRAIAGVSMGATASLILAGRHPGMFRFVGSFSGFQDMSSPGMPAAVNYMTQMVGRESATNMWGPYNSRGWLTHDPKLLLAGLRGATVYLSAGTGTPRAGESYGDPEVDEINNQLEPLSRVTTAAFASQATAFGVDTRLHLRDIGSHTWYSWVPELHAAWSEMAGALGEV